MPEINLLDDDTINRIAAGEVVDRPSSIVKELFENAADAGATAITVEIVNGGIDLIRITDNGSGIEKEQIRKAFMRHATSKITSGSDLMDIKSFGFRGEALSSIASVTRTELITKTAGSVSAIRFVIEGGIEKEIGEVGAPDGTTLIIRDLFFNTPVRRKFLKTATTEGTNINELMERLAVSHPEISVNYINSSRNLIHTNGSGSLKDAVYSVFGRNIAANMLKVYGKSNGEYPVTITGFIGKPAILRGNRNLENYFINGRYVKNPVITKAVEEAYKSYAMQHQYPFTILFINLDSSQVDVNVHPAKLEVRFTCAENIYSIVFHTVLSALSQTNLIKDIENVEDTSKHRTAGSENVVKAPEPFENAKNHAIFTDYGFVIGEDDSRRHEKNITDIVRDKELYENNSNNYSAKENIINENTSDNNVINDDLFNHCSSDDKNAEGSIEIQSNDSHNINSSLAGMTGKNNDLPEGFINEKIKDLYRQNEINEEFISTKKEYGYRIIGQVFDTYIIVEMKEQLFIIDQHAAHEKVMFEKFMKESDSREYASQLLNPPKVITLTAREKQAVDDAQAELKRMGYDISYFGGNDYAINAIPIDIKDIGDTDYLIELIDDFSNQIPTKDSNLIRQRIATMSCKAAIKGNHRLSELEEKDLVDQLLKCENPYFCPHGRPVIVSMTKYEMEKKFKRIV